MICSRLRLIFLAFGLVLMSGAALADWELEIFVDKGLRPHASNPNYVEYRFVKINAAVWGCDGYHCPCGSSACPTGWSPIVPCVVGTCPMGPAQGYERCIGDNPNDQMFSCMDVIAACFVIDMTQGDCHSAFEHMFDDVWNGYDPTTGRTRIGFPPHRPRIKLEACKDYEHFDDEWLPEYDDILCFKVTPSMPMNMTVRMNTTTYQGIAMNYGVPSFDSDTTNDLVPWPGEGGTLLDFGYHDEVTHTGYFFKFGNVIPTIPLLLYFRVQDYATAAGLVVYQTDGPAHAEEQIPRNYNRFLSSADDDEDGLTAWEEYRGFITWGNSYGSHSRTDSTLPQLFVLDNTGITWNLVSSPLWYATGFDLWSTEGWPSMPYESRYWLDFMIARTETLCEAGYDPPRADNPWIDIELADQALIRVEQNNSLPYAGGVRQYNYDAYTPPLLYRGPSGSFGPIEFNYLIHLNLIIYLMSECELPYELQTAVLSDVLTRTLMHEYGHVFGINHHYPDSTAGSYDCVMKYDLFVDYPFDSAGWAEFSWGTGYLADDWNCANEIGLRP